MQKKKKKSPKTIEKLFGTRDEYCNQITDTLSKVLVNGPDFGSFI